MFQFCHIILKSNLATKFWTRSEKGKVDQGGGLDSQIGTKHNEGRGDGYKKDACMSPFLHDAAVTAEASKEQVAWRKMRD